MSPKGGELGDVVTELPRMGQVVAITVIMMVIIIAEGAKRAPVPGPKQAEVSHRSKAAGHGRSLRSRSWISFER